MEIKPICTKCGKCTSLPDLTRLFADICGSQHVITEPHELYRYGEDQTLDLHFPFDILLKPGSAAEISDILKICNRYKIPVTPRGGGSGVTGGALPVQGGVVLSLERLNKIIAIQKEDAFVVAESGVITADLCKAVEQEGLYFPVIPTSSPYSFVGGNVAENAGCIRSCRYGTTGQYVLNLEVVLPDGEIIWTGANVAKNATGLNLTGLFTGSEGILGVITKVVYRLLPCPEREVVLLAAFDQEENACSAVLAIRRSGIIPSAVELIWPNAVAFASAWKGGPLLAGQKNARAYLLVELRDNCPAASEHSLGALTELMERYTANDILVGETTAAKEKLWGVRKTVGDALEAAPYGYRDLDVALPLSGLYPYLRKVEELCRLSSVRSICFGHALDGNVHTMLLADVPTAQGPGGGDWESVLPAIYGYAISCGGVISGEHGIGWLQKDFMKLQFSEASLDLMRRLKAVFDPNHILNPGKVI